MYELHTLRKKHWSRKDFICKNSVQNGDYRKLEVKSWSWTKRMDYGMTCETTSEMCVFESWFQMCQNPLKISDQSGQNHLLSYDKQSRLDFQRSLKTDLEIIILFSPPDCLWIIDWTELNLCYHSVKI